MATHVSADQWHMVGCTLRRWRPEGLHAASKEEVLSTALDDGIPRGLLMIGISSWSVCNGVKDEGPSISRPSVTLGDEDSRKSFRDGVMDEFMDLWSHVASIHVDHMCIQDHLGILDVVDSRTWQRHHGIYASKGLQILLD